jgi:hypothetical protein
MRETKKLFATVCTSLLVLTLLLTTSPAFAAVANWQAGTIVMPRWNTDFGSDSFKQSMQNLAATHVNSVSLGYPIYQSSMQSSDIQAGSDTPTDASLAAGIDYIHSLGLAVILVPHLECWCGGWRANINASDRATWFANYSKMLNHLGTIGQAHGVQGMVIGVELIDMASGDINSDNTTQWNKMIASLRSVYGGKLSYSANWGSGSFATETNQIKFWNSLDQVGISAYYELPSGSNNVSDIMSQWNNWNNNNIKPLNTSTGKPIVFTEIGYVSASGNRYQPWNPWCCGGYDATEQANLYNALFGYWNNYNYVQGAQFWNWSTDPNAGGQGNADYTVQNKPAQSVLATWLSGNGTSPTPPPPPVAANFAVSSKINATAPSANVPLTITGTVVNNASGAINNVIVDMEVYNSQGTKLAQKFFENQNFTAGQSQNYTLNFTPANSGNYQIAMGVFNSDWTTNYIWNGNTSSFSVGTTSAPPPNPTPTTCNDFVQNGFKGCYFNSSNLANFVLARNDAAINFDWGSGSPDASVNADNFSAQWQGTFSFNSGTYNFTATTDDGMRVWVDNNLVLDKWIDQPTTTYNFSLPMTAGNHNITVKYYENTGNAVAKVSWAQASSNPPPPPPAPQTGVMNIWWPTDGGSVTGVQPFKGLVQNLDLSQYRMYWQVDNDALNLMGDSQADYPHKEALVDTSNWNWQSSGDYKITFVAKDLSGNVIATQNITIHVTH